MGVPIKLPLVSPQPHTYLAFEGYQYARVQGTGNDYNHRVLTAFFVEGQDIGQIAVLTKLAGDVGLKKRRPRSVADTQVPGGAPAGVQHAYEEEGVTGVPMFVIGSQVLTGLQDRETLEAVIEEERQGQETPTRG
jgi:predicted DsbA family dithiol-disulfide isomerase